MTKTKNIKVQYSSRCTGGSYYGGRRYTSYPKIQMEGKWLEALGFHVGDMLHVEYEEGFIRISPVIQPDPVMMVAEPSAGYGRKNASNSHNVIAKSRIRNLLFFLMRLYLSHPSQRKSDVLNPDIEKTCRCRSAYRFVMIIYF